MKNLLKIVLASVFILLFPTKTQASVELNVYGTDCTYTISTSQKTVNVSAQLLVNNKLQEMDEEYLDYDAEFIGASLPLDSEESDDGDFSIRPSKTGTFKLKVTANYIYDPDPDFEDDDDSKHYTDPSDFNLQDLEASTIITIKVKPMNKMWLYGGLYSYNVKSKTFKIQVANCSKETVTIPANCGYANCYSGDIFDRDLKNKKTVIKSGQTKNITFKIKGSRVLWAKPKHYEIHFEYKYKGKKYDAGVTTAAIYYWTGSKWKKMGKMCKFVGK